MDVVDWFRAWVAHHPLKQPADANRASYTAEVLARVKALAPTPPAPSQNAWPQLAWRWPQLAVGLATAAASVFVLFSIQQTWHQRQLARAVTEEAEVLVALDEDVLPLEEELLLLAETPAADEQWLEELSQVLEAFDEDVPLDDDSLSDDEWLKTLEQLDEPSVTTPS